MSSPIPSSLKTAARAGVGIALTVLGLVVLIQVLAHAAAALQGEAPPPPPPPEQAVGHHTVSEWPADKPRQFDQAPLLDPRVEAGELPPVEDRLPDEPLVVHPPEQIGPYGGTWTRYAVSTGDVNVIASRLTYENPLRWSPTGQELLPNLLRDYTQSDDGKTFTLHLRKGVRWSDGHPFTADDILFWYDGVLQNESLTFAINRDLQRKGELVNVEKIDDHTVRFAFEGPHGVFPERFLATALYPQSLLRPKHYLKQFHPDYREREPDEPVNENGVPASLQRIIEDNGHEHWSQTFLHMDRWQNPDRPTLRAWRIIQAPPERPVIFERNPYYWKVDPQGNQLPYMDYVQFEIDDPEIIKLRIIDGHIGMQARHITFQDYPLFMRKRREGNYQVLQWQAMSGNEIVIAPNLNHRDPVLREILQDRQFRIALSHAIDRSLINEAKYHGQHHPRQVAPAEGSPVYDAEYESAYTTFDPDKARRLLDEMGLTHVDDSQYRRRPDGRELKLRIDVTDALGVDPRTIELIAQAWRDVGIRAEVNQVARPLFYQRKGALMHDVAIWSGEAEQMPILDPRWLVPFSQESNHGIAYARWFNSGGSAGQEPPGDLRQTMTLYEQIEREPDPEKRKALWRQIIDLNHQNLWVIGVVGQGPVPVIKHNHFRNLPDSAATSWGVQSPGNTATEIYAIDPELQTPSE